MGGPPSLRPDAYERASAHTQAHRISSPVLILSGDADYLPHCLTMTAALLMSGKDCSFGFYEKAWHTFWWNRADIPAFPEANRQVLTFLDKHLKNGTAPRTSP